MAVYHGRKGKVYLSTTGTGNAVSVLSLTNWSLDMKADMVDVTAFNDTNKGYVMGLKDTKGSIAGFWNDADESLFTGADSADGVKLYLYPSADAMTKYWYGPAWLDASIDTDVNGAVKVTAEFVANGSWGHK